MCSSYMLILATEQPATPTSHLPPPPPGAAAVICAWADLISAPAAAACAFWHAKKALQGAQIVGMLDGKIP